tara:strand:- start:1220 stop:1726 length:507 start_codon:yes stop_codon:yes gene_type:complete
MKITKTRLRQIIKEEITRVNESPVKGSSGKKKKELSAMFKLGFLDGASGRNDESLRLKAEYRKGHYKGVMYTYNDGKIELARAEIAKYERELNEDRTSDSIGLERSIDNSRESLSPKIEKIMRSTYIGGYAADGAPSLWDTIESVSPGAGEKTLQSLVLQLANMQQYK